MNPNPPRGPANLGLRIRSLREERHWTQTDLATRIRANPTQVRAWEHKLCMPHYWHMIELSRAFRIPLTNLVEYDPRLEEQHHDNDAE